METLKNTILAENVPDKNELSVQISKLWNKSKFIAEGSLSDVYLSENGKYIFKVQKRPEVLIREFKVGIQLNKINSPYLTQYYFYGEGIRRNRPFALIAMEYVKGKSYYDTMETLNTMEKKVLTKQILCTIAELKSQIKFTHYDLHGDNIIVDVGPTQEYTYQCFGQTITINSPYRIKFIDYDLSYVDDVEPLWLRDIDPKTIINGCISDIYDDFYDMSYFIMCYLIFIKTIDDDLNNLIKPNSFYVYSLEEPLASIFEYGREHYPDWAVLGDNRYRPLFDNYYCDLHDMNEAKSVSVFATESIQRMKDHLKVKNINSLSKSITQRMIDPVVSGMVDNIGKEFGSVMRWNKMQQMNKRTTTVEQLFTQAMTIF